MPVETRTCVVVLCDVCGEDWWKYEDEPHTIHFESMAEARDYLDRGAKEYDTTPWSFTNGVICPTCVNKAACARDGHVWDSDGEWTSMGGEIRECVCGRCQRTINNLDEVVCQLVSVAEQEGRAP